MKFFNRIDSQIKKASLALSFIFSFGVVCSSYAGTPDQRPLFLVAPVKPLLMLTMPKEQQLFYKLYNDYTDIASSTTATPDGTVTIADTTYNPIYEYYGYFDSKKCYSYSSTNSRFEPSTTPSDNLPDCTGTDDWSGNFLNWATMTRIDAIRKILYGGLRSVDSATTSATALGETVLERAFLPNDAHSFAKFYAPMVSGAISTNEMKKVIPDGLADATGVTFCNTTDPVDAAGRTNSDASRSQNVNAPPLMKAAKGNYSLWAANERWQCGWKNDPHGNSDLKNATNANNAAASGINAYRSNPSMDETTAYKNYTVRVQVCKSGFINGSTDKDNEKCFTYEDPSTKLKTNKPRGLLQIYGENNSIYFGLVTGTYAKNKTGGVLRKAARSFTDEVNASTGVFLSPTYSIVNTLNKLRIYGYRFDDGTYFEDNVTTSGTDNCKWGENSFVDGKCTNWGNPQAEIYLEALRYLAGVGKTASYAVDSDYISGLTAISTNTTRGADWADPIETTAAGNYCTPLNIMQFNASITSYDADELGGYSGTIRNDVSAPSLADVIDNIATNENILGNYYFGKSTSVTDATGDGLCTAKNIDGSTTKLSTVRGICPESPRLEGSYAIAGLAYAARKYSVGIESTYKRETVKTFGVSLASALPKVEVTVPNSDKKVTIIPACQNTTSRGNCAIVDFKVIPEVTINGVTSGKLYVVWEDSEQGGDFDQDMWGTITYDVSATQVTVTTRAIAESSSQSMGFGYVISGVTDGGFKVDAGVNGYTGGLCTNCQAGETPAARTFVISATSTSSSSSSSSASTEAKSLQLPLYYAAKWGGWNYKKNETTKKMEALDPSVIKKIDPTDRTQKGTYYYATEPKALYTGLDNAFAETANIIGSASTVTANSTSIQDGTRIYQARFDSSGWTGQLLAYPLEKDGTIRVDTLGKPIPVWDTDTTITRPLSATTPDAAIPTWRKVYTSNNATPRGNAVLLSDINSTSLSLLKDALKASTEGTDYTNAAKRFNWLLGSVFYENTEGGLRIRKKLLGDIINSDPAYAGATSLRYEFLPSDVINTPSDAGFGASSYQSYVVAKSQSSRTSAVFVGANDGMLHAFNAATGSEIFAYIPRGAYSKLLGLTSPNFSHTYSVDGPIFVSDVFISPTGSGGTKSWRTIVAGTLGNGGAGAYALDVTDVLAGTATAPRVIFDVSSSEPASGAIEPNNTLKNDLGYSQSKVLVLPAAGGKWVAVWGNGTNSVNGYAKLIAIDVETPTSFKVIDTEAKITGTNDNGLSGVALLPSGTGVLSYAYAGDLKGNMWKFNLTDTDISQWSVAFRSGGAPAPLINVIDPSGNPQPISATPTLGRNSLELTSGNPSTMLYFGTGKYSESSDNDSRQVQSLYGIADTGRAISISSVSARTSKLWQKSIATESSGVRTLSNDSNTGTIWAMNNDYDGWFMDLKISGGSATGERILSKPLLLFDRVIINTFIASSNPCDFGGSGWLMELTGVGDVYKTHSVLGDQANRVLDRPIIGDLLSISAGEKGVILGSELGNINQDGGITIKNQTAAAGSAGRMSWRQIK